MLWCEGGWNRRELQVQSNMNLMFLELTFVLMLLLVLLQTYTWTMSTFPWIFAVLPTQFLNYTFKLSTDWPVAVMSSTCNCGKEHKRLFPVIISYLLYCLNVTNCVQCSKAWLSYPHWSTRTTWQWDSDQCWQFSGVRLDLCQNVPCAIWSGVTPSPARLLYLRCNRPAAGGHDRYILFL